MAIGLLLPVLLLFARLALLPWMGERAPFALVFVAVVGAAVLAGWRSGLLALIVGQLLVWYFIIPQSWSFVIENSTLAAALLLATAAELLILIIITLYQREVALAWSKREGQMGLLEKALAEIDHRTVNNYEAVLALILAQAKATGDQPVKEALQKIADRIKAIANASRRLAATSESLEKVRLDEHLRELCAQIEEGLARGNVGLECEFTKVSLEPDQTTAVSMLVNELVTNALKHAFPDGRDGVVRVALTQVAGGLDLVVKDNGVGLKSSPRTQSTGLGSRLVDTFVRQLRAKHEVETGDAGTRHRIRFRT